MNRKEIGRFNAITFNEYYIEFIVYDDNTMDCPILGLNLFKTIELKPRFHIYSANYNYTYDAKSPIKGFTSKDLIEKYDIDDNLFYYLKENKMIMYSTDMAYIYNFVDKNGYDRNYRDRVPSPYKWAKKKRPILIREKLDIHPIYKSQ